MEGLADDLDRLRASVPRRRRLRRRSPVLLWVAGAAALLGFAFLTGNVLKQVDEATSRRRVARQVADDAARAGARLLDPRLDEGPEAACEAAWSAVVDRLGDAGAQPVDCAGLAGPCRAGMPGRRLTGRAGGSSVVITHPVGRDEDSCQRMAVRVEHRNRSSLAASLGLVAPRTAVRSVAAAVPGVDEFVPLVVLDPTACPALDVAGRAGLHVLASDGEAGAVLVESDGSAPGEGERGCGGADRRAVDVADDAFLRALPGTAASGRVQSHALARAAPRAYERADARAAADCGARAVPPCFRLQPRPTPAANRRGRAPVDDRYQRATVPSSGGEGVPPGFSVFPRPGTPDRCDLPPSTPPLELSGDWYVRCSGPGSGAGFRVSSHVSFGGGSIVFEGGVTVGPGGSLAVNVGRSEDASVTVRGGDLATSGTGALALARTFVHLAPGATLDLAAGAPVTWTAPQAGPFEDLALWVEGAGEAFLRATPGSVLEGVAFLPDTALRVEVTGDAEVVLRAQLVVGRLRLEGDGVLALGPQPARTVRYPVARARLVG